MLHPLPSRFKARAPDVTAEFATSLNVLTLLLLFFEFEPVLYDGVAVVEHGRNGVVALAPNSTEGCERARLAGPASGMASSEENVPPPPLLPSNAPRPERSKRGGLEGEPGLSCRGTAPIL